MNKTSLLDRKYAILISCSDVTNTERTKYINKRLVSALNFSTSIKKGFQVSSNLIFSGPDILHNLFYSLWRVFPPEQYKEPGILLLQLFRFTTATSYQIRQRERMDQEEVFYLRQLLSHRI